MQAVVVAALGVGHIPVASPEVVVTAVVALVAQQEDPMV